MSQAHATEEFDYHRDAWIFQGGAFIERVDKALSLLVPLLVSAPGSERAAFENKVRSDFRQSAAAKWGVVRNPLTHGLGGGIDALTPYWLPLLALPAKSVDIENIMREAGGASDAKADRDLARLAQGMATTTVAVIAESERVFQTVIDRLEGRTIES